MNGEEDAPEPQVDVMAEMDRVAADAVAQAGIGHLHAPGEPCPVVRWFAAIQQWGVTVAFQQENPIGALMQLSGLIAMSALQAAVEDPDWAMEWLGRLHAHGREPIRWGAAFRESLPLDVPR